MLQKLLIASFSVFLLAACSGSSSESTETLNELPPEPDPGCELPDAEVITYEFEAQEDVDAWFINGDGMNVQLDFVQVESAMSITPLQWHPDDETWQRQARTELEEVTDLSNTTITVEMNIPESYLEDDGWGMQLVAQGEELYADFWIGAGDLEAGENEVVWEAGDAADATHFGIQLTNIPSNDTMEPILVYEVEIEFPVEDTCGDEEPAPETMDIDLTEGWFTKGAHDVDGDVAADPEYTDDGVSMTADKGNQQLVTQVDGPENFDEAVATFTLSLDQDYLGAADAIQPFGQVFNVVDGDEDEEVGGEWGCWNNTTDNIGNAEAGEEFEIVCPMSEADEMFNIEEGQYVLFGVQADGAGTITVHDLTITLPEDSNGGDGESGNEVAVTVDEGWQDDGSPVSISYDDGVVLTPDWDGGQQVAFVVLDEVVDMTDATVTYVIDVPESYVEDGGMVIQPFSQQNADPYSAIDDGAISGGWNPAGDLEAGENTIVHGPFDSPPEDIQRVGVWLNVADKAAGVDGDIIIRSVTITFPE